MEMLLKIGEHLNKDFEFMQKLHSRKETQMRLLTLSWNLASKEAIERAKTFVYAPLKHVEGREDIPAESAENVEDLMKKFKEMCNPQGNVIVERHKFNTRDLKQNEPIETYIADLGSLADNCEYGDLRDKLIRDRLVCGVQSDAVRKQML